VLVVEDILYIDILEEDILGFAPNLAVFNLPLLQNHTPTLVLKITHMCNF